MAPGSQILTTHFVEFETPAGELIRAKVFLIVVDPAKSGIPAELAKKAPVRIFGTGFEIEHHGGPDDADFVPDFFIPAKFVERIPGTSNFMVNLGDVTYKVVTTVRVIP